MVKPNPVGQNNAKAELKRVLDGRAPHYKTEIALLGDGNGIISVPGKNGWVYVRVQNQYLTIAYNNSSIHLVDGITVIVGYDEVNPYILQVLDSVAPETGETFPLNVPVHHKTHEWLNPEGGSDTVWIDIRQWMPFRVEANNQFILSIFHGLTYTDNGWVAKDIETLDISAHIPGTGQARYIVVCLNESLIVVREGALTSGDLLDSDIPDIEEGDFPLAVVQLFDGQVGIVENRDGTDLMDARFSGRAIPFKHAHTHEAGGSDPVNIVGGGGVLNGSGSLGQIAYFIDPDTIAGNNSLWWDPTSHKMYIGRNFVPDNANAGELNLSSLGTSSTFRNIAYGNNSIPIIGLWKGNGTPSALTPIQTGQILSFISTIGSTVTDWGNAGWIKMIATGNWTDSSTPAKMLLSLTGTGHTLPTDIVQVDINGLKNLVANTVLLRDYTLTFDSSFEMDLSGAADGDVIAFDGGTSVWKKKTIGATNYAKGEVSFFIQGHLADIADAEKDLIITSAGNILKVYCYLDDTGTSSSTIVDVKKNGVSIFVGTPKPEITWNGVQLVSVVPDTQPVVENDIITISITQTAPGSQNLTVVLGMGTIEITGPQGPQGNQGTQGTQGVQGAMGFTGPQGTQGDQGSIGATGIQGVQGLQGYQGTQGVQGLSIQGPQGYQGYQGVKGNQGFQGVQGPQGGAMQVFKARAPFGGVGLITPSQLYFPRLEWDSSGTYDVGTSHWVPPAGYAWIHASIQWTAQTPDSTNTFAYILKNGGGSPLPGKSSGITVVPNPMSQFDFSQDVSAMVSVNGSDVITILVNCDHNITISQNSYFEGFSLSGAGAQGPQGHQGGTGSQGPQGVQGASGGGGGSASWGKHVVMHANGTAGQEFAPTDAGLTSALAAASYGDVIEVAPGTFAGGFTVPTGVGMNSQGNKSGFTGTITLGGQSSHIKGFQINVVGNTNGTIAAVIGPASGSASISDCMCLATNNGSGPAYGVQVFNGDVVLWSAISNGTSAGGAGYAAYIGTGHLHYTEGCALSGSTGKFFGNHVSVYNSDNLIKVTHADKSPSGSYTSLASALSDHTAGDTYYLPEGTISGDHTLPTDAHLVGKSRERTILSGKITLGIDCVLKSLSSLVSASSAGEVISVVGPPSGSGTLNDCSIDTHNTGSGNAVGVNAMSGNLLIWSCSLHAIADVALGFAARAASTGNITQESGSAYGSTAPYYWSG